jgi:phage recombination protein Bet
VEISKSNGHNGNGTALAVQTPQAMQQGARYSQEQLDLLKRTIARGTTNDQFALFMGTADRLGLDPFSKHIYAVLRKDKNNPDQRAMTIQVAIDGFRAVADRTGETDGQDGPYWCGDDGIWVDVWLHETPPKGCKIDIYRKGRSRPFRGVATRLSYYQGSNPLWDSMPDNMLAKCAEALGLRKAFPAQLSGVYTPEEMDQAGGVIDAEVVSERRTSSSSTAPRAQPIDTAGEVDTILAAIAAASNPAALNALTPRINKAVESNGWKKTGAEYKRIAGAWKARKAAIEQAERDRLAEDDGRMGDDSEDVIDAEGVES